MNTNIKEKRCKICGKIIWQMVSYVKIKEDYYHRKCYDKMNQKENPSKRGYQYVSGHIVGNEYIKRRHDEQN